MIKAIIFDLDNCLAAANEVGEDLYAPLFFSLRASIRYNILASRSLFLIWDVTKSITNASWRSIMPVRSRL